MSVVELKTRPIVVNEDVILRLEEALIQAREGKIAAVAIAVVHSDGAISRSWSESDNFALLLGSVARTLHALNVRADSE